MDNHIDKKKDLDLIPAEEREQKINDQNIFDAFQAEELNFLKRLLFKIWGITELLQNDIGYIKRIYTKPIEQKKQGISREERIAKLKHKLLTSRKKRI